MIALNRRELQASLGRMRTRVASEPQKLAADLRPAFGKWGEDWRRGVHARFEGGGLSSRSGRLKGSIDAQVTGSTLDTLALRMESKGDLVYAPAQEHGGVIRPKNAQNLTIPTRFNRTAAGRPRFPSARALIAAEGKKNTFFAKSRGGALFLWWKKPSAAIRKSAGKGGAVPMFVLVKEVDLPGPRSVKHKQASRLGFYDTWNAQKTARAADLVRIGLGAA